MADFSLTNLEVFALYGSVKAPAEIPAGKGFEIHATGLVINANPGITAWTICMTIWNITQNKGESYKNDSAAFGSSDSFSLARNLVMPATDVRYRVKIFATQNMTSTAPAQSRW